MPTRTRYRFRDEIFGAVYSADYFGGPLVFRTEQSARTFYKSIEDTYGKERRKDGSLPPSDLSITEEVVQPIIMNYERRDLRDGPVKAFRNCPLVYPNLKASSPAGSWDTIEEDDTYYVAKLLADSNPFNYSVSVPITVIELVEATSLLMLAQSNFLTMGGSAYLNYQFGIKPLMADIKALYNITKTIEDKLVDFNRLVRKGGLRVKRFLGSGQYTSPSPTTGQPGWSIYGEVFRYSSKPSYTSKVWGTCRWRPKRLTPVEVSKLTSVNTAMKYALDLGTPDASTIWELIPFSWLVDYFVNIGDTLTALEQSDVVEPYDICIMRTRTVNTSLQMESAWWHNSVYQGSYYAVGSSEGRISITHKLRKVKPTPTGYLSLLRFGLLSEAQALNLTALLLTLTRFKK